LTNTDLTNKKFGQKLGQRIVIWSILIAPIEKTILCLGDEPILGNILGCSLTLLNVLENWIIWI